MRISNPGYVLKSTTPAEHKAIAEANDANRAVAVKKMEKYASSIVPGSSPWAHQTDTGAIVMTGFLVPDDITLDEIHPGLRWDTKARGGRRILVPAKRTEDGKDFMTFMDLFRHRPQALGAVSKILTISNGTDKWFASAVIEVLGDDVYATYFHPLDGRELGTRGSDREMVEADPAWEVIALSKFHAAREQCAPEKVSI